MALPFTFDALEIVPAELRLPGTPHPANHQFGVEYPTP
jgi:hypothetical protein